MTDDKPTIWTQFRESVNMAPLELEKWLESDESRRLGRSAAAASRPATPAAVVS